MNLAQWLSVHHLDALAPRLIEAGIDCDILEELTDSDLAEAGLTLGDRRRLLKAIRESDVPAGDTLPAVQAQSSPVPPGERRHLTVMFCDLVGSTALSARLDPEDLRELVARYHQLASSIIQRFGGFAAQFMGDGVMAFFGYPTAHEDDAEHAVRAGLALVKELTGAELTPGERVAVRVGIATGEVVVGELGAPGTAQENAAIGETPNLAARLQAMGEPGTVVISSATRELTSGAFEYRDMGSHLLRGLREPVTVSQVLRLSDAVSRFEARHDQSLDALVGRDREIAHLHSCWHAAASGSGQVVLIGAEPGLGKSRIVAALQHALEEEGARVRRHFCSPYHSDSPLHPFAAQLSRACALTSGQSQSERLARVVAAMGADSPPAASDLQLVAELLGIEVSEANDAVPASPQQKRSRLFELLLADLERAAAGCPVLLIFEDAHWSDPTSLELLGAMIVRAAALKVMVVITHRPEFVSPWGNSPHLQTLALDRLDRTAAAKIVTRVAQGRALPPALLEDILARTDGVPLFIEELTRSILESGALRTTPDGFELVGPVTMSTVPMSLSASLLARLDRLTLSRAVAQTGAAIGREFNRDLLADVLHLPPARLEAALAEICASGLIVQRIEDTGPLYVFKHALIQEVAYSTLLRSRRQQLHGLIAAALEGRFPEVVGRQPELLARHLAEAGLAERAIGAYRRAGQLALSRSASVEAATHIRHAIALLSSLPPAVMREPLELALQTALGVALSGIGGYSAADAVSAFERARVLVRLVGSQEGVGAIFDGLFINFTNRGDLASSMEIGREFLAIARQSGDAPSESVANRMLGVVYRVLAGC